MTTAAGASAAVLTSGLLPSRQARANPLDSPPKPIPGGFSFPPHFYHLLLPAHPLIGTGPADTQDPSSITDFNGHIGLAYVTGTGTHTDKNTGEVTQLPYEVDLRFMKGTYVGEDGNKHHRTFALV